MRHLATLALLVFLASCAGDGAGECSSGESLSHACVQVSGSSCTDTVATCAEGQWQCAPGFAFTGAPCASPAPDAGTADADLSDRDCSELGGGQAVLAERCLGETVEYCIYSDSTQTASWSEIETCSAPQSCQERSDEACCLADSEEACP